MGREGGRGCGVGWLEFRVGGRRGMSACVRGWVELEVEV